MAACAAALAAMTTSATADPLLDTFKALCFDTQANAARALAEADRRGWATVPPSALAGLRPSGEVEAIQGRAAKTKDGLEILFVAHGKALGDFKLNADLCGLIASPADGSSLKAAAAKFAAVEPEVMLKETGSAGYIWQDAPNGRKQVTAAALQAGTTDPSVRAMMVTGDASQALIVLAVPTQVSPN
jgi:hypothetical protein